MNSTAPNNREKEIFEQALNLAAGAERLAFVKGACGRDAALCARVLALLQAHETAEEFLPEDPKDQATVLFPITEKPGDKIGRYRLMEKIGEGGCGIVYVAEQEEPVRRRVALKVIKLGMDTREVVARFEAERQALALMDHPNIARVFDGGATDTGRPYFVLELVRGVRITDFCDQHQLPTIERLKLFIQVCHAIQHAHQKGIIHRDIKPSNILVSLHDDVPVPKVIDFGIAKAVGERLTDKTVYTRYEQFMGTPAYMSPEQAGRSDLDVDTRSDIYALGVLLYELLAGRPPFDPKQLAEAGLEEMVRCIREQEPLRPSTRLSQLQQEELTTTAQRRGTEPPKLISLLRGDLDWIVMKCLEKNRTRRYDAANALARDIECYLNQEPITARPPSTAYRVGKFVRRNKVLVAAGSAVAAALVLGIVGSTWQAIRAMRAEREQSRLRTQAQANGQKALEAQAKEAKQRRQAQAQAYASDMKLAQEALAQNNLGWAQQLLDRHRPRVGETDLRGWEWRYLWGQCRGDFSIPLCKKTNSISALAVSADGNWLAVGEHSSGVVSVTDLRTRREMALLEGGDWFVRASFSPTEPLLAFSCLTKVPSTNQQHSVRLWDATIQKVVAEFPLAGRCANLTFSSDGRTLITYTGTVDRRGHGQMTLWQVPQGREITSHPIPPGAQENNFNPLAVARDLSVAAYIYGQASVSKMGLIDLATGTNRWTAESTDLGFSAISFSPDESILATASFNADSRVRLLEAASGKDIGQLEGHRGCVWALLFWPDGRTLASGSYDQTIRLWDMATHQPLGTLGGHRDEVWQLALLPDNTTLVSGSRDGSVRLWDTAKLRSKRAPYATLANVSPEWCFATNSKAVITVGRDGCIARWLGPDFWDRQPLLELGTNTLGVRLSRDGRLVATGSTNGRVEVWDVQEQKRLHQLTVSSGPVKVLGFLAQGKELATIHLGDRPVSVPSAGGYVEWSKLAIVQPDAVSVHEWDLSTGRETRTWRGRWPSDTFAVAQSADERWLLALGLTGSIWLVDRVTGGEVVRQLQIGGADDAAFSWDGKRFAAASWLGREDGAKVWDTSTLRELAVLPTWSVSVAFSPDGKRLALGGIGKRAITLWDVESQQEVLALEGEGSNFWRSEFSPDGNVIGSASMKGVLHLWRAPSWAEIEAAESQRITTSQSR